MTRVEATQRIEMLLSLHRPEEAERLTRERLTSDPDWAVGHSLLALCLLNARSPQVYDALSVASRGVALGPTIGYTHAILGCALSAVGDESASEREFQEGLRLDPADTFSRAQYAWSLYRRGKVQQALVLADEGRADAPDDPHLLELIAYAELELTDYYNARQTVSTALAAHPDNHVFHYLSGLVSELTATPCHEDFPLYEAAVASYAEAVRIAPTIDDLRDNLDRARAVLSQIREDLHALPVVPGPRPRQVADCEADPVDDEVVEDDRTAPALQWLGTHYPLILIGGSVGLIMLAVLITSRIR
jgi:tetratricopeptide (TPR) repeat protein